MASRKHLGPGDVTAVWVSPEQLQGQRIDAALEAGASARDIADLATGPALGEFRESLGVEEVNGKIEPKLGERLVWVHPVGADAGWYERYTGADADYKPVLTPDQEA